MGTAARVPRHYRVSDPERALKYAVQHIAGDRAEIIEGVITPVSPSWAHENAAEVVRRQPTPWREELGPVPGSGTLDLPGSANWFIPDLAVVPLLVGRQQRECTVFSDPGRLGCAEVDGPRPFGSPVRLPAPFDPDPDTGRFRNRTRRARPDEGGSGGRLRWGGVRSRQTHGRAGA